MSTLKIDYYSDVLCVWAWISQRRLQELTDEWAGKIDVHFHFLNVFGDVETKIKEKWSDRGGYEGFGQHVLDAVIPYDNAIVNPNIWSSVRPKTSANAHLILNMVMEHWVMVVRFVKMESISSMNTKIKNVK